MVDPAIIQRRLRQVEEYLKFLHGLRWYSLSEFLSSPERYGSAERFLHLCIEALTDIGNHVVADLGLGIVSAYSDVPKLLAKHGYIDAELEGVWIDMIGFRNILVHEYLEIDRQLVFEVLHEHLEDLDTLRRELAQFLEDK